MLSLLLRRQRSSVGLLAAIATTSAVLVAAGEPTPGMTGADDVVVIAVIDNGFDLYHFDWLGSEMPQHLDDDPSNDLPLDTSPDQWLPGFPDPSSFDTYDRLDLTLPLFEDDSRVGLNASDASEWSKIETSTADAAHYYWAPDTKVIGLVDFDDHDVHDHGQAHGSGTSSVAAGARNGSCPECLVVFVDYGTPDTAEDAINWVMDQPWIDVITNSYGLSATPVTRDRLYAGSDTGRQRSSSERGQTIFFSAGNGQANTFTVPNSTLYSSQEGPDWIMTVGAISPGGASFTGAGKPVDVASLGLDYPSSYCNGEVTCEGKFSGTSNSTPVVAGMYAQALHRSRVALAGPSRVQEEGLVAVGEPIACGAVRPDCELGDGKLTAVELRTRFLHGAVHTDQGYHAGSIVIGQGTPTAPPSQEHEFLAEGHGSYFGRYHGDEQWLVESDRIFAPMVGTQEELERPDGEEEWFLVDSWCRQQLWGEWNDGFFLSGRDELPPPSADWPIRSALTDHCTPIPGQG